MTDLSNYEHRKIHLKKQIDLLNNLIDKLKKDLIIEIDTSEQLKLEKQIKDKKTLLNKKRKILKKVENICELIENLNKKTSYKDSLYKELDKPHNSDYRIKQTQKRIKQEEDEIIKTRKELDEEEKELDILETEDEIKNELLEIIKNARKNNATELNLGLRNINELPPEIGQLTSLLHLDLENKQLSTLPETIGQLTNLYYLNLRNNQLTILPETIGELTNLILLHLANNKLSVLPDIIGQLTNLKHLQLYNNQLNTLPATIGELTNLIELSLRNNQLSILPEAIGELTNLNYLDLSNNQLTALPETINQLTNLITLDLRNNQLPIPPEILKFYNQPAIIIDYYMHTLSNTKILNEAKLFFVGQGGVGKTLLARRLFHNSLDSNEYETKGIDIRNWYIEINGEEVRVNIWDFGGQQIMHSTHQFFLTTKSLYILVWDARQENTYGEIEYWLRLIKTFGGDSPVIIVLNKIDIAIFEFDRIALMKKYKNIKAFIKISSKTGEGIDGLSEIIKKEISSLKHIRIELPLNWFNVKMKLENMEKDYIKYTEYEQMCEADGISKISSETLIQYLHDLGIILYFQDDSISNIIKLEWITNGIYTILNSEELYNNGILEINKLDQILYFKEYLKNKHIIIDMMKKFELCFELEADKYIIPELLPKEQAQFKWDYEDSLAFQYHYEFLPSIIISRFIVRMHPLIFKNIYWKYGLILVDENNLALVIADIIDAKIYIYVTGNWNTRRSFLAQIRYQFEHIHKTIANIEVKEFVPLFDNKEIVIAYEDLLKLQKRDIKEYYYPAVDAIIDVQRLLDGIDKERRESINFLHKLLNEKIRKLEEKLIIETNSADMFKIAKEIEEVKRQLREAALS